MTSRKEIPWLESEVTTIDRMLAEMSDLNVLSRMNMEHRKAKALSKLAEARNAPPEPSQTRITFSGEPLSQSTGLKAAFAGSALEAVSRMAGGEPALSLAGTAWGHFGFRLVLLSDAPEANGLLKHSLAILRASAKSPDALAAALSESSPAMVAGVEKFVKLLLLNEALCSIEHDDLKFSFTDLDEVKASAHLLERVQPTATDDE